MKRILCCDIDGVLSDMTGIVLHRIWCDHGLVITPDQLTHYQRLDELLAEARVDPGYLPDLFHDKDVLDNVPIMLPAIPALRRIRGMVQSIHIVTARNHHAYDWVSGITRSWLDRYGIPYDKLVFSTDKAAYCRSVQAGYLIEDAPQHAEAALALGVGVFLLDHPYNRQLADRGGLWRVGNHREIVDLLEADLSTRPS